jgi:hypothetical protein
MTLCETRSIDEQQYDVDALTTNFWIRRLQYLREHRLERAYGIVKTSRPV